MAKKLIHLEVIVRNEALREIIGNPSSGFLILDFFLLF